MLSICKRLSNNFLNKSFHSSPLLNESFFQHITANELWKSVTSVSPAGKKRGRGKGKNRKIIRDLNKGQVIGFGRKNMLWPGLNAPVLEKQQMLRIKPLPPDPEREKRIFELRDKIYKFKPLKLTNMERGWSGGQMGGRSLGPPDDAKLLLQEARRDADLDNSASDQPQSNETPNNPYDDVRVSSFLNEEPQLSMDIDPSAQRLVRNFEKDERLRGKVFDSKVLKIRIICHMTGDEGRVRRFSCIVVTGNRNGLIGFAFCKHPEAKIALRMARNKAFKHLIYVERHDERTIFHTLYGKQKQTDVFLFRAPQGHGIIAHRVIKTIAELAGIKDLYAKVERSQKNYHNITRCLFEMLARQETYQQLADRTGFHVVEFSPEREFLPVVLAAPSKEALRLLPPLEPNQPPPEFEDIYTDGGKLYKARRKPGLFYADLPSYARHLKGTDRLRNLDAYRIKMTAEQDITGRPPHPLTQDEIDRWAREKAEKLREQESESF